MKLSESLQGIGRPVAYFPSLARAFKSVNAAIFFAQIFYWMPRAQDKRGVYKTAEEIEEETGLSVQEQRTARKKLRDAGVLVETHDRLNHRMFYRIDVDALDATFPKLQINRASVETALPEVANQHSLDSTETTTEIKAPQRVAHKQRGPSKKPTFADKPDGVDESAWCDWLLTRKEKRAGRPTVTAMKRLENQAEKAGLSIGQAIEYAAANSWVGFNAEWYESREGNTPRVANGVGVAFT